MGKKEKTLLREEDYKSEEQEKQKRKEKRGENTVTEKEEWSENRSRGVRAEPHTRLPGGRARTHQDAERVSENSECVAPLSAPRSAINL